jgi:hypothetical protein
LAKGAFALAGFCEEIGKSGWLEDRHKGIFADSRMSLRLSVGNVGIVLGVRSARRAVVAAALTGLTVVATRVREGTLPVPDSVVAAWLRVADGPEKRTVDDGRRDVAIDLGPAAAATVDERFLSVAIDSSQLVGGHWWSPEGKVESIGRRRVAPIDLSSPQLRDRARALAPAYLRVGGTEADRIYYALGDGAGEKPSSFDLALTPVEWSGLTDFAKGAGLDLFFTLNAGPSTRDAKGQWTTDNAERLLSYARGRGDDIRVLELGNEINGYWFTYGLRQQPDGPTIAADLEKAHALARKWFPDAVVLGPAEFYWPRVGSPFSSRTQVLAGIFAAGNRPALDAVSWHYYPQQSRRCPIATRRATLTELLDPASLDEVSRWASDVESTSLPNTARWLSETGGAQCGGEPGVSDRFASSLWWMDELGLLARRGESVVVRQTLVGSNYGLLDENTLEPRPDYYASLLFKRLMGRAVLDVRRADGGDPFVRVYAHCTAPSAQAKPGSVTLLAINLHQQDEATLRFPGGSGRAVDRYEVTAPSLDSAHPELNGRPFALEALTPRREPFDGTMKLAPASYTLAVVDAELPVCSENRSR